MKVNTDGVLLGAWAKANGAESILDIGTGTGVIALMMAQKNKNAIIAAIDIDEGAFYQAKANFEASDWKERLMAIYIPLQQYQPGKLYDVIISNPPYFVDDQKSGNQQRDTARHSVALTYAELLEGVGRLLASAGSMFVVIPSFNYELFKAEALKHGLHVTQVADVVAVEGRQPYLVLLQLQRVKGDVTKSTIVIQNVAGEFTEQYKQLTKDFYLKF